MNDYIALLLGIAAAGLGGELFVRGAVGLAHWARVSPGIIGATVAAFATSSPELSVSITAAMAGKPQIAFGDALGSNVANIALILALALSLSAIAAPRERIAREFPVALTVPIITGVLLIDGVLSRLDGALMLGIFFAWFAATVVEARRQRSAAQSMLGARSGWTAILLCAAGLVLLVAAGRFVVSGGRGIALAFGIDEFVVGATIVAVGTSVPELATAIVSKLRGHDEVGLGTILGSNIFNGLLIVPVAALIFPIRVDPREAAVALLFGLLAVVFTYPGRHGLIERKRGPMLLVLYAIYLAVILRSAG